MGYDLTNSAGGYQQWKALGWWHLLNLALNYGWVPAGTTAPDGYSEPDPWDGNYFHNAGQRVTRQDAAALADALDRLLRDPNRDKSASRVALAMQNAVTDASVSATSDVPGVLAYPLDYVRGMLRQFGGSSIEPWSFDERSVRYLGEFVAFCRQGSFVIG